MNRNKDTVEMIEHFKKEWSRQDIYIFLPKGVKSNPEWKNLKDKDIVLQYKKYHPQSVEWKLKVLDLFNIAVVKNQHGYYIEQLAFDEDTTVQSK